MRKLLIGLTILLAGCGNQARLDYYAAVQAAAEAQSRESEARYNALASMARSSDPGASTAAVMAIALAQKPTVQPQYIEDDALKWAQVLAGPVAAIASLAIQADLSRDLNDSNKDIAIARINADSATDQALYSALTRPVSPSIGTDQLDSVVSGLVTLGVTGIDGVGNMGAAGLDTATVLSIEAMDNILSTSTTGYQTIEEIVGKSYMTIDSIAEDCGGCGSCFICTPPPDPVVDPTGDPDPGLCVSPCIAPQN